MKIAHIVSGSVLIAIALVLSGYSAYLWQVNWIFPLKQLYFWELQIALTSLSAIFYVVGALLIWKGRHDWTYIN